MEWLVSKWHQERVRLWEKVKWMRKSSTHSSFFSSAEENWPKFILSEKDEEISVSSRLGREKRAGVALVYEIFHCKITTTTSSPQDCLQLCILWEGYYPDKTIVEWSCSSSEGRMSSFSVKAKGFGHLNRSWNGCLSLRKKQWNCHRH